MNIITIILARGGSKGIYKKNLMHINGLPLVYYPIKASQECKYINRTIVSTDDNEIARVCKEFGAEVPFKRPKSLSMDKSLDIDCFIHALNYLEKNENYIPDIVVHLRATAPLITKDHISDAISILRCNDDADSVRSVNPVNRTPYKMWKKSGEFIIPILDKECVNYPRQLLPKVYDHNGYVDVIRYNTLMKKKSMTGDKVLPYIMNEGYSFDIDDSIDLDLVRNYFNRR
jgi:CMP-N,N'-diacetyllegionaminic acid synthase